MAKISIPQKFPIWQANHLTQYSGDFVGEKNVKTNQNTGEVFSSKPLKYFSGNEMPVSIFKEQNHFLSFATKTKLYYIDSLSDTNLSEYSPNIPSGYPLDVDGTGAFVYPRGYPEISADTPNSGTLGTTDLSTFGDVKTITYSYTTNQKVVGVRFYISYSQSSGQNKIRFIINDGSGDVVVGGDSSEVSGGYDWNYWIIDGDSGINLNSASGFTAKIQAATNGSGNYISWTTARIDILLEKGENQIGLTSPYGLLFRYNNISDDKYYVFSSKTSVADDWNIYRGVNLSLQKTSSTGYYYPFIVKRFNERNIIVGQGQYVHIVNTLYSYATAELDADDSRVRYLNLQLGDWSLPYRLKIYDNYKVKWIETTNDLVFIGAVKYNQPFDETNDFVIIVWDVKSDSQETIRVVDGNCIGKVVNNYLYILTEKGNIQILYNYQLKTLVKVYQTNDGYQIQLPHINGVIDFENNIYYLIPGNKDCPAGIYVFNIETQSVNHFASISYDDYGGDQPQVEIGALFYQNDNGEDIFFAGVGNVLINDGSFVDGLYKTEESQTYSYLELPKIKSPEINLLSSAVVVKHTRSGSLIISERKIDTGFENYYTLYSGTWNTGTNSNYFTMTSIPQTFSIGDRIIVVDGTLKGYVSVIKQLDFVNNRVYVDAPNIYCSFPYISVSGSFSFLHEPLGYKAEIIDGNTISLPDYVVEKLEIGDEIEFINGLNCGIITYIEDISETNITLSDTISDDYSFAKIKINKYRKIKEFNISDNKNGHCVVFGTSQPEFSEFSQFKIILKGEIRLNEIQINIKPNLTILEENNVNL